MKYSHIPGTDIKISQLAVGGMSFGIPAVKTLPLDFGRRPD